MGMRTLLKSPLAVVVLVLAIALVGFGAGALVFRTTAYDPDDGTAAKQLWTCSMHPQVIQDKPGNCPICGMKLVPLRQTQGTGDPASGGERKVKYWWDPMMTPPYISDKPGKSPMGMDLIPVYEDELAAGPTVSIDPVMTQNMGLRIATVRQGPLDVIVRTVGYLREAEPRVHDVTLKVSGWIERLHADTEGQAVSKGDTLFEIYSPDLLVAQNELLAAHRGLQRLPKDAAESIRKDSEDLVRTTRERLRLWGVPDAALDDILASGKARPTVAFPSPAGGFVAEKSVVQGSAIEAGQRLMRIVDQSLLWLDAQVYEPDFPLLRLGQKAQGRVGGVPGRTFDGEVVFIAPRVDQGTRTVTARLAFDNRDFTLKPGMYATIETRVQVAERTVLVPRAAVINTGIRQVAFVSVGAGRFEPRLVQMGRAAQDGDVQVLSGLAPGESVVVSGQFLLDAESRMREAIDKMTGDKLVQPPVKQDKRASPPAHQHKTDALIAPYLEATESLAQDRPVPAAEAEALRAAAVRRASADPRQKGSADAIVEALEGFERLDLKQQRDRWERISASMIAMLEANPPSDTLHVVYCPMVDAEWLQSDRSVRNPYMGASMLDCGEVRRSLSPEGAHD